MRKVEFFLCLLLLLLKGSISIYAGTTVPGTAQGFSQSPGGTSVHAAADFPLATLPLLDPEELNTGGLEEDESADTDDGPKSLLTAGPGGLPFHPAYSAASLRRVPYFRTAVPLPGYRAPLYLFQGVFRI